MAAKSIFEEYYPLDQIDFSATVNRVISNKVDVVFNTVIPPGVGPFFKQLYEAGFLKNGGRLSCVYYDENTLNINQAAEIEGLASCLDYFKALTPEDPFSAKLQATYEKQFPGTFLFAAGSAATGTYRGLKLWEAAVKEAGKVDRDGGRRGAGSRQDRRRSRRARGNGSRQAALQDEDVHGRCQGRQL